MDNIIYSDQIENGEKVLLRHCGWKAVLMDGHKKRSTRLALVDGLYSEIGSIYSKDIHSVFREGDWIPVTPTEKHSRAGSWY